MTDQRQKNSGGNGQRLCYLRNHKIVERRIDDTVFLVNPEADTVFYLNPLGTAIWQLLAKPISAAEAANIVQLAFPDVPSKKITEDVSKLLDALNKRNLVLPAG
jgi:hypothetical protein